MVGLMLLTRVRGKIGHWSGAEDAAVEEDAAAGCVPGALCDEGGPAFRCPLEAEVDEDDSPVVAPMAA